METNTCPRRSLEFDYPNDLAETGSDSWIDKSCSFCGSINPELFLTLIKDGCLVIPIDDRYKVYIRTPNGQSKLYFQHLSHEQRWEMVRLYNDNTMKVWGMDEDGNVHDNGDFFVLPYFAKVLRDE